MSRAPSLTTVRLRHRVPVFVCRKCLKRTRDGSDLKRALKAALKQHARERGTDKPRLVMTSCFGLCPKRAIVAASGGTLQRGEMLVIGHDDLAVNAAAVLLPNRDLEPAV